MTAGEATARQADPRQPDPRQPDPRQTAQPPSHARHRLDEIIHAPVRFSLIALLTGVDEAEFARVRDEIEVSDSVLSKQIAILEQAGYLAVRKGYVGKRPRTWLSLTGAGRAAFDSHLAALREIAGQ